MHDQNLVDIIIENVLRGSFSVREANLLEQVILSNLEEERSIDAVLLGCTELSALYEKHPFCVKEVAIIDPVDILSQKLCRKVIHSHKIHSAAT